MIGTRLTDATAVHEVRFHLAGAILVRDDQVLIVRRSMTERFLPGIWGVPCGKVDPGELPSEAVIRELKEETGLTGEVVRQVGESGFISTWHGTQVYNLQTNFLVRPTGSIDQLELPLPDQEARWIPADSIEEFAGLDDYNRDVIRQWASSDKIGYCVSSVTTASSLLR